MKTGGWLAYRYLLNMASSYRERGYDAIVGPARWQLPVPHARHTPDILVHRDDSYIAVQVKFSSVRRLTEIEFDQLADEVRDTWPAGSTTDLVWSPFPEKLPPVQLLRDRLADAAEIGENHKEAAYLLAFSALEGALLAVSTLDRLPGMLSSVDIAQTLRDDGFLTQDGFDTIYDLAVVRNRLAHGVLPRNDIVAEDLDELFEVAKTILSSREARVVEVIDQFVSQYKPAPQRGTDDDTDYPVKELWSTLARTSDAKPAIVHEALDYVMQVSPRWSSTADNDAE